MRIPLFPPTLLPPTLKLSSGEHRPSSQVGLDGRALLREGWCVAFPCAGSADLPVWSSPSSSSSTVPSISCGISSTSGMPSLASFSSAVYSSILAFFATGTNSLFFTPLPPPALCFYLHIGSPFNLSFPPLALHLFFPLWKCIFQRLSLPAFPHMAPFYFLNQTGVSEGIFVSQSTLHHSMPSKNSTQLIYYHMTFRVKRAGHEPDSAEVRTLDPCGRDSGLAARDRSRLQV